MFFLLLLVFDIFLNHLGVKAHRIYTVTFRPKMISPVRLFLQLGKLMNKPDCNASFQDTHEF